MSRSVLVCLLAVRTLPAAESPERYFDKRVAPILTRRCLPCHNSELTNAGINFLDRDTLVKPGPRGPAVAPGKPEESVLIAALRHDRDVQMPPGPKLPEKEIAILTELVRRGAVWGTKMRSGR